jgi:hypothetical protein
MDRNEQRRKRAADACVAMHQARLMASLPPISHFPKKQSRKPADWPSSGRDVLINGYKRFMDEQETRVLDEARQRISASRPSWREQFVALCDIFLEHETDQLIVEGIHQEREKALRALGMLKPTRERIREQTRQRVRRYRERQRKISPEG